MNEGLPMKQILLVEDDHDIAALLRLNLEDEGYAITHEPDGGNALQRLEKPVGCGDPRPDAAQR
jgi:CheY-like chemotaxis protein